MFEAESHRSWYFSVEKDKMKYKGYIGKVELDAEAGILHGEVVGI